MFLGMEIKASTGELGRTSCSPMSFLPSVGEVDIACAPLEVVIGFYLVFVPLFALG